MGIANTTTELSQDDRRNIWKELAEEILISVYVPEAEQMTHDEALKITLERDLQSAADLQADCVLHLETAAAEAGKN